MVLVNGCTPARLCLGTSCSWQSRSQLQGWGSKVCAWVAWRQLAALRFCFVFWQAHFGVQKSTWQVAGFPQASRFIPAFITSLRAWACKRQLAASQASVASLVWRSFTAWRVHSRVFRLAEHCVRLGHGVTAGGALSPLSPTGSLALGRGSLLRHGSFSADDWLMAALCFAAWEFALDVSDAAKQVLQCTADTSATSTLNLHELD